MCLISLMCVANTGLKYYEIGPQSPKMTMIDPLFYKTPLESAVNDLRTDLLTDGGPQISTMRNYRFAILPYDPIRKDSICVIG
jgi:hypothetical protein